MVDIQLGQALLYIGILGILLGVLIGLASIFLAVEVNPLIAQVRELLPGFNCGACGTAGCDDMSNRVVDENYPTTNCKPGTENMRRAIAKLIEESKQNDLDNENSEA
jgi:electron transport complex protein RnfB